MGMDAWIAGHVGAFGHYGGVPQILVPDNALTATHRKQRGDAARFVNDRYRQMADHYGTAVVPARVSKPRDKAAVESAVNTVNKRVIGYLLEDVWTTLAELNEAIAERVLEVNHDIRRADGTTRWERFTAEEAPALIPLPDEAFEQVEWRQAKVGRNYHVTTDHQHYSVPWQLAGRLVRVRLTGSRVTVFDGQQVVAEHRRSDRQEGPVLHRFRARAGAAPRRGRAVVAALVHRPGRRVRAGDGPGDRADPRPARDRGAGLPGLPEHPGHPRPQEQAEARGGLPGAAEHRRAPDVLHDQAADGGHRQRRREAGARPGRRVHPEERPGRRRRAGALVRGADYYRQGR